MCSTTSIRIMLTALRTNSCIQNITTHSGSIRTRVWPACEDFIGMLEDSASLLFVISLNRGDFAAASALEKATFAIPRVFG